MSEYDANNPPSALDSFAHLIASKRQGLKRPGEFTGEIPKPVRIKSAANKMLARALPCGNPNCQFTRAKAFSLVPVSDPHHIRTRGAGGGDELANLCPLCRGCHDLAHAGKFTADEIREWALVVWPKTEAYIAAGAK